jgi:hypothetical protein
MRPEGTEKRGFLAPRAGRQRYPRGPFIERHDIAIGASKSLSGTMLGPSDGAL